MHETNHILGFSPILHSKSYELEEMVERKMELESDEPSEPVIQHFKEEE